MSKKFNELSTKHIEFIEQQKIFFVGTAAANGTVNISPKGYGSLKVLSPNRIIWLNVTGSGNETSAHVQLNPRMTMMFTSFDGSPVTLRIYGKASVIHKLDEEWEVLNSHFEQIVGARQIFDLAIELVQTSCGMSIPYFEYKGDRDIQIKWATKKGEVGLREFWGEENQQSIDGFPTNILEKS
jgi:Pyridoxamine 5'-phosphate oxidase